MYLLLLEKDIENKSTLLGFVGVPWTLAAYVVEGKSSKNYSIIKSMAFREPDLLHNLLDHFAESIGEYLKYQVKSGAQIVQIFDSWAGQLSPQDYDIFAGPYQKKVVDIVKKNTQRLPSFCIFQAVQELLKGWLEQELILFL